VCGSLPSRFPPPFRQLVGNGRRQTVMHLAASRSSPRLDYVRLLAELRPELREATDRSGLTPLHPAADQVELFFDVLGGLERRDPVSRAGRVARAARCWTLCGSLRNSFPSPWRKPIVAAGCRCTWRHRASSPTWTWSGFGWVEEARPEALVAPDHAGSLPLHGAVALNETTPALEEFLAAEIRHSEGDDDDEPAEIAVRVRRARRDNARTLELVQILIEGSSESVQYIGKGTIPLLVAAENDAPPDVLFFLATAWPEAIYVSRRCGGSCQA
jgi:Ankyrin repeats (many copies)